MLLYSHNMVLLGSYVISNIGWDMEDEWTISINDITYQA